MVRGAEVVCEMFFVSGRATVRCRFISTHARDSRQLSKRRTREVCVFRFSAQSWVRLRSKRRGREEDEMYARFRASGKRACGAANAQRTRHACRCRAPSVVKYRTPLFFGDLFLSPSHWGSQIVVVLRRRSWAVRVRSVSSLDSFCRGYIYVPARLVRRIKMVQREAVLSFPCNFVSFLFVLEI